MSGGTTSALPISQTPMLSPLQRAAYLELIRRGIRLDEYGKSDSAGYPLPGSDLPWRDWVARFYPHVASHPFAPHHAQLWDWFDALTPGVKPRARVAPWPRGGGKSSTGELGCVRVGAKLSRRFVLYVSSTQPQADGKVQNVGALFERLGVGRAVNKYGSSKGWRRDQLRTENGFNVAAIGLDAAVRGIKLDEFRPDLILFDDVDLREDTAATTDKKVRAITTAILPAGSSDCAILFLQNLIHKNSILSQMVDGRAPFLHSRDVSEVVPAAWNLQVAQRDNGVGGLEYYVTGGVPTWDGQDLSVIQVQINEWGLPAFLRESQQEVEDEEGGLWSRDMLSLCRWGAAVPPLHRIIVGVDPNASTGGDEAGIVVAGVGRVPGAPPQKLDPHLPHGFVLEDATVGGGPKEWAEAAVSAYHRHRADTIVAEKNNGGEMVALTLKSVTEIGGRCAAAPPVKLVHASRGKITRAEPVQKLYADGRVHHCGHFGLLETEMCTYRPGLTKDSPGRMDALVWALTEAMLGSVAGPAIVGGSRPAIQVVR